MPNKMIAMMVLLLATACAHPGGTEGQSNNHALVETGHRLALLKCARCHAIDGSGESANPNAPPFREVSRSITIMANSTTLSEGIRIGHIDMPPMRLTSADIDYLNAYLRSLQTIESEH